MIYKKPELLKGCILKFYKYGLDKPYVYLNYDWSVNFNYKSQLNLKITKLNLRIN